MNKKFSIRDIALVGVMAAAVFVASQVQIKIPAGLGFTRIHIGNGICLLSGLLLGPLLGGLAAGMGSAIFDILDPVYISSALSTFVFKFLMAYICGKIAWGNIQNAENRKRNLIGSILGASTYIVLYLVKSYFKDIYVKGLPFEGAVAAGISRLQASLFNGVCGVIIAMILIEALRPIYKKIRYK